MSETHARRILVVTDRVPISSEVAATIREHADTGAVQFRLIVLNPASTELHLLHPERHDKAAEAERVLAVSLPDLEAASGSRVIGSVSVRSDPMDAIEETMADEPVDEIILAVPAHHIASWLHQDLQHRLAHLGLPVTSVRPPGSASGHTGGQTPG